ncbi:MAG: hypothetical protein ACI8RZ_003832 [Myxococcota bacterium]
MASLLVGAVLTELTVTYSEIIARFSRADPVVGVLRLPKLEVQITPASDSTAGLDEDERLMLTLYQLLDGCSPILSVAVGWTAALTVGWAEQVVTIRALSDTRDGETIWTVEDAKGPVVLAFAGGGPVGLRSE